MTTSMTTTMTTTYRSATGESFVHLHVASGYSMRYGTARPHQLVERAAAFGQPALALTDRDGLYGAVKFVRACMEHDIAPILGVDLAIGPEQPERQRPVRTPVRGGALVDPRLPRVTVLARGSGSGLAPGAGWAALCRLVTATHLRGERGNPVTTASLVAEHARTSPFPRRPRRPRRRTTGPADGGGRHTSPVADGGPSRLVVLLGPDSDVGRAVLAKRRDRARAALERWVALLPRGAVVVEVVCHGGPEHQPGSLGQAARMLALAREVGVPSVITAAVRHTDPQDAAIVDVLDAARRLVALDARHLDRVTTAGHLSPTPVMHALALDVVQVSGPGLVGGGSLAREQARELLARTTALAAECVQDPRADLGIGSVHLPEPGILGIRPGTNPHRVLARRCRESIPTRYPGRSESELVAVSDRLEDELGVIETLGYATYFLTVAQVCDLIREMGVRVAARGSGAGSLVNYLLGISGVDPMRHGLLMERFCSPLRAELPDIDIDVESARRTEIYERILDHFGGDRVTCVSMMDTYRVRHAIRDAGAALGLPPARDRRHGQGLPAHRGPQRAPCPRRAARAAGERSRRAAPAADVRHRRAARRAAPAHRPAPLRRRALRLRPARPHPGRGELARLPDEPVRQGRRRGDGPAQARRPRHPDAVGDGARHRRGRARRRRPHRPRRRGAGALDDEPTFELVRSTKTLGCFQIESPGQRELIGKFGPRSFDDLIIDISLFRPGPVKSDMIIPFLNARQGWKDPVLPPPDARAGARGDRGRRRLPRAGADDRRRDDRRDPGPGRRGAPCARHPGRAEADRGVVAPGGPGPRLRPRRRRQDLGGRSRPSRRSASARRTRPRSPCRPTSRPGSRRTTRPPSSPGVLTHDPGMYPKRLILDDARTFGIAILGLDVNVSTGSYRFERTDDGGEAIRLSLADVHGISEAEVAQIVAGQPYSSLSDFWQRAHVSRPIAEKLVLAGGFDSLHDIDLGGPSRLDESGSGVVGRARGGLGRRGRVTRRDLLLHVAELDRWSSSQRSSRRSSRRVSAASRSSGPASTRGRVTSVSATGDIRALAAAQSQASAGAPGHIATQLTLDLGDTPRLSATSGLPEMTGPEQVRAELEVLGLDASGHVVDFYGPLLDALGVTRARDLLSGRSGREVLVAGVKVATQTPPIRTGRRVVFLTLDDATGPADLTFFEDVQGPYAATVFHSWLLLCRGVVRRTGPRGVSIRATGAWELSALQDAWTSGGITAVRDALDAADRAAWERATALAGPDGAPAGVGEGPEGRRVLVHASGFKQSPYADIKPAGDDVRGAPGHESARAHRDRRWPATQAVAREPGKLGALG